MDPSLPAAGPLGGEGVSRPAEVLAFPEVLDVALGADHTCVVVPNGEVHCWGANDRGQLGRGHVSTFEQKAALVSLPPVTAISAALGFTCAIDSDRDVWCWGENDVGQLGRGYAGAADPRPEQVGAITGVRRIDTAAGGGCAALTDGSIWCWGRWHLGAHPDGPAVQPETPTGQVDVSRAGSMQVVSLGGDGRVWDVASPAPSGPHRTRLFEDLPPVIQVFASRSGGCGRTGAGRIWCWTEYPDTSFYPERWEVGLTGPAIAMDLGDSHGCALLEDGSLWCFGRSNLVGQLGDGTFEGGDMRPVRVLW